MSLRAELEQNIKEMDKYLKLMLDSSPLSCQLLDKDINCIGCNETTVKLFGLNSKQEYIDIFFNLSSEYPPNSRLTRVAARDYVQKTLEEGQCNLNRRIKPLTACLFL